MNIKKIVPESEIKALSESLRKQGKKIVFTNGCFDILHAGHVSYLEDASTHGDILILGLNSDSSVKQIKGSKRPIISQDQRARVLSALACIDYVVIFDESDPGSLIEKVCPNVLVKGADWSEDEIIGGNFVKQKGGRVERITLKPDISTTIIINRIVESFS